MSIWKHRQKYWRDTKTSALLTGFDAQGYQDQVRDVMVIEAYMMVDVEGSGTATLHRILKAGNALLEVEEVERKPFIAFCPLPIPHSFYGSNFADRLCATQNAKDGPDQVNPRSRHDHQQSAVHGHQRWSDEPKRVDRQSCRWPRKRDTPGCYCTYAASVVEPVCLPDFAFESLDDQDAEDLTGVSRLSQGLNKDAISKQNSAAMVEQLTTMSQQRQKIIARNFAEPFCEASVPRGLSPGRRERAAGKDNRHRRYVRAHRPARWKEKRDVMVELKLGYGEQDREAQADAGDTPDV